MVPRPPEEIRPRGLWWMKVLGLPHLILPHIADHDGIALGGMPDVADNVLGYESVGLLFQNVTLG